MLRTILISLFIILTTYTFILSSAEARRFGGGSSFGMSRSVSSFSRPSYSNPGRFQQAASAPSSASRWLGPLAGFAAGGLLASLFMGHGMGSGIFSWLMVIGVGMMLWRFLGSRILAPQPMQNANFQSSAANTYSSALENGSNVYNFKSAANNFDEAGFLRQTKSLFIRLQAAYDSKNLADIREFTAPEVFAEIQLQFQERGDQKNLTEVVSLDAELLDYTEEVRGIITSVLFSGLIREQENTELVNVKEIWHFLKKDEKWMVAGIQQA